MNGRSAAQVAGVGVLIAVALVGAGALLVPDPPRRMALPAAGELVALERYLDPSEAGLPEMAGVPETVRVPGSPFGDADRRFADGGTSGAGGEVGVGPGGAAGAETGPRWSLSAVMVAGERRVAILNDRMVRPGDRLGDGTRVEGIGTDHIVIITPDGQRRRLDLES